MLIARYQFVFSSLSLRFLSQALFYFRNISTVLLEPLGAIQLQYLLLEMLPDVNMRSMALCIFKGVRMSARFLIFVGCLKLPRLSNFLKIPPAEFACYIHIVKSTWTPADWASEWIKAFFILKRGCEMWSSVFRKVCSFQTVCSRKKQSRRVERPPQAATQDKHESHAQHLSQGSGWDT